jgi:DNA-binding transcriptional MerR regulator
MSIKNSYSIKDLENLTGVKAHTIRIWEKRYELLEPMRSETNIRNYNEKSLLKLLNIALLNENGVKVSKIAKLSENEIYLKVRELVVEKEHPLHAINDFKVAMLNFDRQRFDNTYNQLLAQSSFRDIFLKVFIKLLEDIGLLWISNTITPAHEHFISTLIKQKLLINIERVQGVKVKSKKTFVLFLPQNEIHDIGILYIHFELLLKGYESVYLGPSVPIASLLGLQEVFEEIEYVSYFTVEPSINKVEPFLNEMSKNILSLRKEKLHVLGRNTRELNEANLPINVIAYDDIISLIGRV